VCLAVGFLNAFAWSIVIPPFQVPDENSNFAYAQYLAETGTLPHARPEGPRFSTELNTTLGQIKWGGVIGHPENKPPWTQAQQRELRAALAHPGERKGNGDVSMPTGQPPLYYALEAGVYKATSSGNLLDRLAAMRVLSCVFAGLTALFAFLFVRELMPRASWTWPVAGLGVAFQPQFAFIASGVNGDTLLFAASAALFYALARALRRGLEPGTGIGIGAALAVGLLTKVNFVALLPAALLALAIGVYRAPREHRRRALTGAAFALGVAAVPLAAYAILDYFVWDRPPLGFSSTPAGVAPGAHLAADTGLRRQLSFGWQLFLPKLPFMQENFWPGQAGPALYKQWVDGLVGRFGWIDYSFAAWVYPLALKVIVGVVALAVAALVRCRRALGRRKGELAVYVVATGCVAAAVAHADWNGFISNGPRFDQARYLFPLLALYGAILALAARVGGKRFGPVIGAAIVAIAIFHDVFAQLLTISRYYA
jgi:4-amino-4-deoxy-L-arabinose transferase-like glycosyltransferase